MPTDEAYGWRVLRRELKANGGIPKKLADYATTGIPDSVTFFPNLTWWIELKRKRKANVMLQAKVKQLTTLLEITNMGGHGNVVYFDPELPIEQFPWRIVTRFELLPISERRIVEEQKFISASELVRAFVGNHGGIRNGTGYHGHNHTTCIFD